MMNLDLSDYNILFIDYNKVISDMHKMQLDNEEIFARKNEVGIEEYYYNNNLVYMGETSRHRRNGHGSEFYQTGINKIHAFFKDGVINDPESEIYDANGQQYIFAEIKNGHLINGTIYRDGQIFYEGHFEEGKISTDCFKAYYPNGTLMFKGGLSRGRLNGRCKIMTLDGSIRLKGEFKEGDIIGETCRMLYKNNHLMFEGSIFF